MKRVNKKENKMKPKLKIAAWVVGSWITIAAIVGAYQYFIISVKQQAKQDASEWIKLHAELVNTLIDSCQYNPNTCGNLISGMDKLKTSGF